MTFQIQITQYFRGNILEIGRRVGNFSSQNKPFIGLRNPVGWEVTSEEHLPMNLTPSTSLPKRVN